MPSQPDSRDCGHELQLNSIPTLLQGFFFGGGAVGAEPELSARTDRRTERADGVGSSRGEGVSGPFRGVCGWGGGGD